MVALGLAVAAMACDGERADGIGDSAAFVAPDADPDVAQAPVDVGFVQQDAPAPESTALRLVPGDPVHPPRVPLNRDGDPADPGPLAITVEEGDTVIPQTTLHLNASLGAVPGGAPSQVRWAVRQPLLSTSKFVPSFSYPRPAFEANVAGQYEFSLQVWDANGQPVAPPAPVVVFVVPDEALHVELLWQSPGDPNPDDEGPMAGTDLDLHFAHPNASQPDLDGDGHPDPWFDPTWDTFWFYATQDWGSVSSTDDDPSLDLDDVDGQGPENINLAAPEDGLTYAIGVNYWNDHGFGSSFATVRVYLWSQMVYEVKQVELKDRDLWWVATVSWPQGGVSARLTADGEPWITHDYHHSLFYQP